MYETQSRVQEIEVYEVIIISYAFVSSIVEEETCDICWCLMLHSQIINRLFHVQKLRYNIFAFDNTNHYWTIDTHHFALDARQTTSLPKMINERIRTTLRWRQQPNKWKKNYIKRRLNNKYSLEMYRYKFSPNWSSGSRQNEKFVS